MRSAEQQSCLHGMQDALDLIEFVSGPADSEWGSLRASMGHPEPWQLNYFAIGNEVVHCLLHLSTSMMHELAAFLYLRNIKYGCKCSTSACSMTALFTNVLSGKYDCGELNLQRNKSTQA